MLKKQFYCQSGTLGIFFHVHDTQVLLLLQRVAGILYALTIVYNMWLRTFEIITTDVSIL